VRLLLWDVDGTLVRVGDLGRDPFQSAIAEALARDLEPEFHRRVRMSGKTDPQIARELLAVAELGDDEIESHLPEVLRLLERHLAAAEHRMTEQGRVMPGAAAVLERCAACPDVVQSVLTGNLAGNAVVKLRAFGLDRWLDLDIGAYGSDHHDREELVPIAVAKATATHGTAFSAENTWVIGDTPRDLACAEAGGARCVLVATGNYTRDELDGLGADVVLDDLSDVDAVVGVLTA
jgi:phosphoglycolate phosphatase-like HAD superfamily hydrolase